MICKPCALGADLLKYFYPAEKDVQQIASVLHNDCTNCDCQHGLTVTDYRS